jgi:undecaprenyl-diphosphatase
MIDYLRTADQFLFRLINQQGHFNIADWMMPFFRNPYFWSPLYLFMLSYLFLNFPKQAWKLLAYVLFTFALTDLISTQIFKAFIFRPRPCWDFSALNQVRMLIPCSTGNGFVSSHAANHFGLSTFLFIALRDLTGKRYRLLFIWAALICYAQVYVGAHYPGDVLGGAALGILLGFLSARTYLARKSINAPA